MVVGNVNKLSSGSMSMSTEEGFTADGETGKFGNGDACLFFTKCSLKKSKKFNLKIYF